MGSLSGQMMSHHQTSDQVSLIPVSYLLYCVFLYSLCMWVLFVNFVNGDVNVDVGRCVCVYCVLIGVLAIIVGVLQLESCSYLQSVGEHCICAIHV